MIDRIRTHSVKTGISEAAGCQRATGWPCKYRQDSDTPPIIVGSPEKKHAAERPSASRRYVYARILILLLIGDCVEVDASPKPLCLPGSPILRSRGYLEDVPVLRGFSVLTSLKWCSSGAAENQREAVCSRPCRSDVVHVTAPALA